MAAPAAPGPAPPLMAAFGAVRRNLVIPVHQPVRQAPAHELGQAQISDAGNEAFGARGQLQPQRDAAATVLCGAQPALTDAV